MRSAANKESGEGTQTGLSNTSPQTDERALNSPDRERKLVSIPPE